MIPHADPDKPLYMQIAEWLETEILQGKFKVHEKVYSQYQLAEMFTINPATAAKGLNVLADEKILYDRRGLGKFVSEEAVRLIRDKRKNERLKGLIEELLREADYLSIDEEELMTMIQRIKREMKGEGK